MVVEILFAFRRIYSLSPFKDHTVPLRSALLRRFGPPRPPPESEVPTSLERQQALPRAATHITGQGWPPLCELVDSRTAVSATVTVVVKTKRLAKIDHSNGFMNGFMHAYLLLLCHSTDNGHDLNAGALLEDTAEVLRDRGDLHRQLSSGGDYQGEGALRAVLLHYDRVRVRAPAAQNRMQNGQNKCLA